MPGVDPPEVDDGVEVLAAWHDPLVRCADQHGASGASPRAASDCSTMGATTRAVVPGGTVDSRIIRAPGVIHCTKGRDAAPERPQRTRAARRSSRRRAGCRSPPRRRVQRPPGPRRRSGCRWRAPARLGSESLVLGLEGEAPAVESVDALAARRRRQIDADHVVERLPFGIAAASPQPPPSPRPRNPAPGRTRSDAPSAARARRRAPRSRRGFWRSGSSRLSHPWRCAPGRSAMEFIHAVESNP
mgnify:CR=1 FL=1